MSPAPDFLALGHVAQDLQPDGSYRLGGTVTYAALLAARLGLRVGVVTSGTEHEVAALHALVPGVSVACVPAPTATIFENRYDAGGHRTQYLRARATPLSAADVPPSWRSVPIALLGPIAAELDPSVAAVLAAVPGSFPLQEEGSTVGVRAATPQGWLRAWDNSGRVSPIPWAEADGFLPHLTALVCSEEDVAVAAVGTSIDDMLTSWAARVRYLVVTDGAQGARLWVEGRPPVHVPAFSVPELDPTGAGDAFAAAFLIALWRGVDPLEAVRYAHAAASYVVAAPGTSGTPTEEHIHARLRSSL
jgi:sugar/nucleoside kinase (ribokinase family)